MSINSVYERWNGTAWVEWFFRNSADNIVESDTHKVMTAAERTAVLTYLGYFNVANRLVKLDNDILIPIELIPDLLSLYIGTGPGTHAMDGILQVNRIQSAIDTHMYIGDVDGYGGYFDFFQGNCSLNFQDGSFNITGGNPLGFGGSVVKNIGNPIDAQDATPKSWVESLVSVGSRPAPGGPVFAASTSNYASFPSAGPIVIDGQSVLTADGQSVRILVKNQTTVSQNGVYTVTRSTGNVVSWTKEALDSGKGILVFVEYGATHNDWLYHNSDGTTWAPFSKVDTVVADESTLSKSGQMFSIKAGGILNSHIGSAAAIATSKLASEAHADTDPWTNIGSPSTAQTLAAKLTDLFSAIKLLRGSADFNTNNTQSLNDAYNKLAQLLPQDSGCIGYLLSDTNIASFNASQTIDGIASGTDGKLIILVGQTTVSQNGVYRTAVGAWTKLDGILNNQYYVATAGTSNANKVYKGNASNGVILTYNGTANIPVGMAILSYV